ncbi:MAG TPA: efflux RND transporter permease subunit [Vicinamibacteria bacterium]
MTRRYASSLLAVVLGSAAAHLADAETLSRAQALARALEANAEVQKGRADVSLFDGRGREAFAIGAGAELRAPLARAVVGGLVTSTLLTLIVVPVVYTYLDRHRPPPAALERPAA